MSTVADEVRRCVEQDPHLRKDLARDVISHAKLARWLQKERGIDGSDHAIISALRRWDPLDVGDSNGDIHYEGGPLDVELLSGYSLIRITRDERSSQRISALYRELDSSISVLSSSKAMAVVASPENRDKVIELLGRDIIEQIEENLVQIRVGPVENLELPQPDIANLVKNILAAEGIKPVDQHTSGDQCFYWIPQEDFTAASDALEEELGSPE